jgi:hypothetical protein
VALLFEHPVSPSVAGLDPERELVLNVAGMLSDLRFGDTGLLRLLRLVALSVEARWQVVLDLVGSAFAPQPAEAACPLGLRSMVRLLDSSLGQVLPLQFDRRLVTACVPGDHPEAGTLRELDVMQLPVYFTLCANKPKRVVADMAPIRTCGCRHRQGGAIGQDGGEALDRHSRASTAMAV